MRPIPRLVYSLLLCTVATLSGTTSAETAPLDTVIESAAQATLRQYNIPGMAIGVIENGKQRFYQFGVASRESQHPVTNETLFEVGSVSKTFTATLAAYAQANGQLALTGSPAQYLPQLQGSALEKVTLLNLATHTAGGFTLQVPAPIHTDEKLMAYFKAWQPTYAAGSHRTYANPSVGLLGLATAKGMGRPFRQLVEGELFPALGMHTSYLSVPQNKLPLYAQGYNKHDAPVRMKPGPLAEETYGVKTSSRDLLEFIAANLDTRPPATALQQALRTTHTGYYQIGPMTQDLIWEQYSAPFTLDALITGNSSQIADNTNPAIALNPPQPPRADVWLNKTGSTSGFGTYVAFLPAKQIGIVILANKNYPSEARVRLAYQILETLGCCSKTAE